MKYSALLMLALSLCVPGTAGAATGCYDAEQQEAEQLVRLHSELMVITLSCRTAADGTSLVPAYQKFTQGNLQRIKDAEQSLMSWHRSHGGGSGEAKLDRLRTNFHNEYSIRLAEMSPSSFCTSYRDEVVKAATLNGPSLTQALDKMAVSYRGAVPGCKIRQAAK